jgi:hypothetical protein
VPAEKAIPVDTVDAFFVLALVITAGFQVDNTEDLSRLAHQRSATCGRAPDFCASCGCGWGQRGVPRQRRPLQTRTRLTTLFL